MCLSTVILNGAHVPIITAADETFWQAFTDVNFIY